MKKSYRDGYYAGYLKAVSDSAKVAREFEKFEENKVGIATSIKNVIKSLSMNAPTDPAVLKKWDKDYERVYGK